MSLGELPNLTERHRGRFERLLDEHRDRILLYLYSLLRDANDAEDVCQRTCLVMWRKFHEYDEERSFLSWACGVARLEAMNHRRAAAADRLAFASDVMQLLAESLDEMDRGDADDRLSALRQCLRRLTYKDQGLIERIYWNGCSCDEIAAELGCTLQTFYNRMYLVRRRLSECVKFRLRLEDGDAASGPPRGLSSKWTET